MPGFDGTGPMGMGPMTGGGRGFCNPYSPLRATGFAPAAYRPLPAAPIVPAAFPQVPAYPAGFYPGPFGGGSWPQTMGGFPRFRGGRRGGRGRGGGRGGGRFMSYRGYPY